MTTGAGFAAINASARNGSANNGLDNFPTPYELMRDALLQLRR